MNRPAPRIGQDDGGREPVIADGHEVEVRPWTAELEHAQLVQPVFASQKSNISPRHVQRREQADDQADRQADAEALELIVADHVQHDGGEDAAQVRVDDGRESAIVAVADGQGQAGAAFAFLAQTLVDQHVGIDGHAEHEHQAGQAGQREGGVDEHHEGDRQQQVGQKAQRRRPGRRSGNKPP